MIDEKLCKIISALDTASGMLIVASMKDKTVREAKEIILKVSFDLGDLVNQEED